MVFATPAHIDRENTPKALLVYRQGNHPCSWQKMVILRQVLRQHLRPLIPETGQHTRQEPPDRDALQPRRVPLTPPPTASTKQFASPRYGAQFPRLPWVGRNGSYNAWLGSQKKTEWRFRTRTPVFLRTRWPFLDVDSLIL